MGGVAAVQVCNTATPRRRVWIGVIAHRNSKYDGDPQTLIDQLTLVRGPLALGPISKSAGQIIVGVYFVSPSFFVPLRTVFFGGSIRNESKRTIPKHPSKRF